MVDMEKEGDIQLENIQRSTGVMLGSYLDIGCGYGHIVSSAEKNGYYSIGIEPGENRIRNSGNFIIATGQAIPIKSNSIDVSSCISVLEHLGNRTNLNRTASEILRILKPSGRCYIYAPNFAVCYEHHFHIFFYPLPKYLARLYLKLTKPYWSRFHEISSEHFIDHIVYTAHLPLRALFRILGAKVKNLDAVKRKSKKGKIRAVLGKLGFTSSIYLVVEKQ